MIEFLNSVLNNLGVFIAGTAFGVMLLLLATLMGAARGNEDYFEDQPEGRKEAA